MTRRAGRAAGRYQTQLASVAPDKPAPWPTTELSGLGLKVGPLTADARDKYQLGQDQKGVVITDVTNGTPAADRGLKAGDVIVEVQQEAVATPDDVLRRIDRVRKANRQVGADAGAELGWAALGAAVAQDRPHSQARLISLRIGGWVAECYSPTICVA